MTTPKDTIRTVGNCKIEGCTGLLDIINGVRRPKKGYCIAHYRRQLLQGKPLYGIWAGMKRRCNAKNSAGYPYYGARGIKVCERWSKSFQAFTKDVGERPKGHQLDRIDNNGDYEPGNVRWVTIAENSRNRRSNRLITHNGETLNIKEWSEKLGGHPTLVSVRLRAGWSEERAVSEKVKRPRLATLEQVNNKEESNG